MFHLSESISCIFTLFFPFSIAPTRNKSEQSKKKSMSFDVKRVKWELLCKHGVALKRQTDKLHRLILLKFKQKCHDILHVLFGSSTWSVCVCIFSYSCASLRKQYKQSTHLAKVSHLWNTMTFWPHYFTVENSSEK